MKCPACGGDIGHEIGFDLKNIWKWTRILITQGTTEDVKELREAGHPSYLASLEDLVKDLDQQARPFGFTVTLSKL